MDSEKFKETLRIKTLERKQRQMESKVEEQEKKLADFAAKLSARKSKVSKVRWRVKDHPKVFFDTSDMISLELLDPWKPTMTPLTRMMTHGTDLITGFLLQKVQLI